MTLAAAESAAVDATAEPLGALGSKRLLGRVRGTKRGPLIVLLGGMHGNEPGGVEAARRVLAHLNGNPAAVRGEVIALCGNPPALARGERYIDRDLNRRWYAADVAALLARDPQTDSTEDAQQRGLLDAIARIETHARSSPHLDRRRPILWVDMHSTSSGGAPFCACSDALRNIALARVLPIPLILGLEECLDGGLLGYLTDLGHRCLVVEGGQHNDPATADFLESAIWLLLAATGVVRGNASLGSGTRQSHHERLANTAKGLPRAVAIRYRHGITDEDGFNMAPGLRNFQQVDFGARLGSDRHGAVSARYAAARVLMPLYQGLGEDGFFLSHDVSSWQLWLSKTLRRLRLDRALTRLLPGVRRQRGERDHLTLNTVDEHDWRARILRLLGYRRCYKDPDAQGRLHLRRRRQDHAGPHRPW